MTQLEELLELAKQNSLIEQLEATAPARNLVLLIKQLVKEQQYEGVALLFTSEKEAARNLQCLTGEVSMELLHDVCLMYLNDNNYKDNLALYGCAEGLLKMLAKHAPPEELLLELLEMVEEQESEYVFTSALRALQVVLLRLGEAKPRALEWSLNSIHARLSDLALPACLLQGYDQKEQRLLEQNEQVQSLLMHYITVGLFYEPLVKDVCNNFKANQVIFRDCGVNRRNVLCCFLLQMLGKPLALLDLSNDERKTNTYTLQCARDLTQAVTHCIGDAFYLLSFAEQRVRFYKARSKSKTQEYLGGNIYLIEDKLPLHALAIYYYMLLAEAIPIAQHPLVYAPLYIFEAGIYLAAALLERTEPPALHYRGILLAKSLLQQLHTTEIPSITLELEVHKRFAHSLCNIVGYAAQKHLRQTGVQLLRQYILQFDNEGKYLILKNLLHCIQHTGICGYLATVYKDLVAEALSTTNELPSFFSGQDFRAIFLQNICKLPHNAETDLIEHSDEVIAALNTVRFFALKDTANRTGFWTFVNEIEQLFLHPLRKGLDLSIAHYKAELQRVESGAATANDKAERDQLKLLNIDVANATAANERTVNYELDRQHKIEILQQSLCTFDLMRSLLARTAECALTSEMYLKTQQATAVL